MSKRLWAIGVDLGGTKIETARIDPEGKVERRLRSPTPVAAGAAGIRQTIVEAIADLRKDTNSPIAAVGVGVPGQVESRTGIVRFAPNLRWTNEPFQSDLAAAIGLPVTLDNDVRVATWGEWLNGAGRDCDDLICVFVGTGIGGGVVSGGRMLVGANNAAGEIGHFPVLINGPVCHCGNRGCMEALAGGWAIGRLGQEAVAAEPAAGAQILKLAGGVREAITGKIVAEALKRGDSLARRVMDGVAEALVAGVTGLVNSFNPRRVILGGGVIEGQPELIGRVRDGVLQRALKAATGELEVVPAMLHNDAGVIGAAALARQSAH